MKSFFELREELEKESIEEAIGDGEYDLSIAMHQWKQGRDRQRAASAAADKAKANRQKRRDAYAKQKAARAAQKESAELDERKLNPRNLDDQDLFKKAVAIAMDKFPKDRKRAEREIAKLERGKELLSHPTVQTALKRAPYQ